MCSQDQMESRSKFTCAKQRLKEVSPVWNIGIGPCSQIGRADEQRGLKVHPGGKLITSGTFPGMG
jgi:hypothetical protein